MPDATIESFTAGDGYVWRYRRYEPTSPPRATIVSIHGIQSHGGWYEYSSQKLCAAGFRVCYLDRRGSGLNEVARGDTPTFGRLLDDLAEFLQSPIATAPVILQAVSWGGKLAVALQRKYPRLVSGLVLLCPGLFPKVGVPLATRLRMLCTRLVSPAHLFPIPLNDPELFTSVQSWRDFIRHDNLALHQATARFLVENVRLDLYLRRAAKFVLVPTLLLLAGQDRIIRNDLTHRYFHRFSTNDKNVITYAQAHHTLEFEPDPDRHLAEVINWMNRHCRGLSSRAAP